MLLSWLIGCLTIGLASCAPAPLQDAGAGVATRNASAPVPLPQQALANIRNLDLRSTMLRDPAVPKQLREILERCTHCGLDNPEYVDLTGDDSADVVVPIYDDMDLAGTVVYSVQNDRPRMVFAQYGSEASVFVNDDNNLEASVGLYAANDPACCASGERTTTYHWNGKRFVVVADKGAKDGLKPYEDDYTIVR